MPSQALSALKFFARMGHGSGAREALTALLGLCSRVRGGRLEEATSLAGPVSPLDGETSAIPPASAIGGVVAAHSDSNKSVDGNRGSRYSMDADSADSRARRRIDPTTLDACVLATLEAQALYEAAVDAGDALPAPAALSMRAAAADMVFGKGEANPGAAAAESAPCAIAAVRKLLRSTRAALDEAEAAARARIGAAAESGGEGSMALLTGGSDCLMLPRVVEDADEDASIDAAGGDGQRLRRAAAAAASAIEGTHPTPHPVRRSRSGSGSNATGSPAGTGTGRSGADATSASYSQLRLQFDLMQAEHKEQLREMRRSLKKALRRIEALKIVSPQPLRSSGGLRTLGGSSRSSSHSHSHSSGDRGGAERRHAAAARPPEPSPVPPAPLPDNKPPAKHGVARPQLASLSSPAAAAMAAAAMSSVSASPGCGAPEEAPRCDRPRPQTGPLTPTARSASPPSSADPEAVETPVGRREREAPRHGAAGRSRRQSPAGLKHGAAGHRRRSSLGPGGTAASAAAAGASGAKRRGSGGSSSVAGRGSDGGGRRRSLASKSVTTSGARASKAGSGASPSPRTASKVSSLESDMQRIRGKMTELEVAMEREQEEKEQLSKILAENSRASAIREQKLASALRAVAAKLPGGKDELYDLLRSIGKT